MNKMLLEFPSLLHTERLYLRPYRAGDGGWYCLMGIRNRAHLSHYESGNPAVRLSSEEEGEILVRELAAAWTARNSFFMGAFERITDRFVAQIYIGPVSWDLPEFTVGYFVDEACEGKGYVTEALSEVIRFLFDDLGAHRVRLECSDTNERSRRVAERCGFKREGHLRENKKTPDGTVTGTLLYGMLRSDRHER